jgi:hypothetical protein
MRVFKGKQTSRWWRPLPWAIATVVVVCGVLASCPQGDDPAVHAGGYRGRTEAEIIRDLGQPAASRVVTDPLDACFPSSAVRALQYEVPSRGLLAYVNRKVLDRPPAALTHVCLDQSGRIVDTQLIQF